MFSTGLVFDMRAPAFGSSSNDLYPAALDLIEYADKSGIESVVFSEHHASEDGYNPVPALMAAAAAGRTKQIALIVGAIILPLHDPVEVAETIAVADLISGGRLHTVLGAGYSEADFNAFGVSLRDRAKLMDRGVEVILRALSGERFDFEGREVFVRPLPASRPAKIYIGGGVGATARRAARFGLGLYATNEHCAKLIPVYEDACRQLGTVPGDVIALGRAVHVTNDPERAWAQIGLHVLHYARSYASLSTDPAVSSSPMHGIESLAAIRASGAFDVVTPDECIALAKETPVLLNPLIAGLDPAIAWENLELFVQKVLPAIKSARVPSTSHE